MQNIKLAVQKIHVCACIGGRITIDIINFNRITYFTKEISLIIVYMYMRTCTRVNLQELWILARAFFFRDFSHCNSRYRFSSMHHF